MLEVLVLSTAVAAIEIGIWVCSRAVSSNRCGQEEYCHNKTKIGTYHMHVLIDA